MTEFLPLFWIFPCCLLQALHRRDLAARMGYAAAANLGLFVLDTFLYGLNRVPIAWLNLGAGLVFAYIWWRIRRKRRKAPALEGAKARLIKATMVKRMARFKGLDQSLAGVISKANGPGGGLHPL